MVKKGRHGVFFECRCLLDRYTSLIDKKFINIVKKTSYRG